MSDRRYPTARLVRAVVFPAVSLALLVGTYVLISSFRINREWLAKVSVPTASSLDSDLFAQLVAEGAIWPERTGETVGIGHTPCNTLTLLSPETALLVSGAAGKKGRGEVRQLCESPQGERIRQEVANFNRSFLLAGIADNRKAEEAQTARDGAPCANGTARAKVFVPAKCLPNEWSASVAADGRPAQSVPTAAISPLEYAFLATSDISYFGDWKAIAPFIDTATGHSSDHVFSSSITLGKRPVRIRTIGIAVEVTIDGASRAIAPGRMALSARGRSFSITAESVCASDDSRSGERESCSPTTASGRAAGTYLAIEGPAGVTAAVSVRVTTLALAPRELRRHRARQAGANATANKSSVQGHASLGAGRVRMTCTLDAPRAGVAARGKTETGCEPTWVTPDVEESDGDTNKPVEVKAGGVAMLDTGGTLTQEAFELGVGDLLGLGWTDAGSVAQVLARAEGGPQVALTIDPAMQKIALNTLTAHYSCPGTASCDRRADLVLMDADGNRVGEVLVAAAVPRPPRGLSAWDIETLERSAPARSPVAAYAWRNHDLRSTPGSSFKLVTALAASQHALDSGDRELTEILLGTSDLRKLANRLGIVAAESGFQGKCTPASNQSNAGSFNAVPIPGASGGIIFCIGNAATGEGSNRSGLESIFEPGSASRCEPGTSARRTGLCEALKDSSNLYFAGLALSIDGAKLVRPGTNIEHTAEVRDLVLARMAARLFPAERSEDAANDRTELDILDVNYPFSGRARSSPLVVEAMKKVEAGEPRRLRLARGGIGLSVVASPLTMATVAASVATGQIVRPHAVPLSVRGPSRDPLEATPVLIARPGSEDLRNALLERIRRGMAAAVTGGTAANSMASLPAELKAVVRAKTGTAPLVDPDEGPPPEGRYAAWVIGYVEPPGGNSGIKRRMAFACRVANAASGGGATCGPIVRDFLLALHRSR